MNLQLITFLVMVAIFMLGCFLLKLPVSVSLVLSSIGGALAAGTKASARHPSPSAGLSGSRLQGQDP